MVTPEQTGVEIVWSIFMTFFDELVDAFSDFLIDDLLGGFFDVAITFIFGGGLSIELAFSLFMALALAALFIKYIYPYAG